MMTALPHGGSCSLLGRGWSPVEEDARDELEGECRGGRVRAEEHVDD